MAPDRRVRRFEPHEWPQYRAVRLEALQSDPAVFGSSYAREVVRPDSFWEERLREPDQAIFGVFADEELVGMTGIVRSRHDPADAVLWGSWLRPEWRRRGLSDPMYAARLAWARAQPGIRRVLVAHRASNLASKAANQRHGFQHTHTCDETFGDGTTEPELNYELWLSPSS